MEWRRSVDRGLEEYVPRLEALAKRAVEFLEEKGYRVVQVEITAQYDLECGDPLLGVTLHIDAKSWDEVFRVWRELVRALDPPFPFFVAVSRY